LDSQLKISFGISLKDPTANDAVKKKPVSNH